MNGLFVDETSAYRSFRSRALREYQSSQPQEEHWSSYDDGESSHPYRELRTQITQIREWVRQNLQSLINEDPTLEPIVRRMLGIPPTVSLTPKRWSLLRRIGQCFIPMSVTLLYIRPIMKQVRTYEGRTYLHEHFFMRMLPKSLKHFTPCIDLALRHLDMPTKEQLDALEMMNPHWVKSAYSIGFRSLADIGPLARFGSSKLDGELAYMLVSEGVVVTKDELLWLQYKADPYHYKSANDDVHLHPKARRMLRVMLNFNIARKRIAQIFLYSMPSFNPKRLEANLTMLRAAGVVDLTAVYEATEELLWRTDPTIWSYVLDVIGARTPVDIKRFKRLLGSYCEPSIAITQRLKALGADMQGLAQSQPLILALSEHKSCTAPLAELNLLATPPHSLNIEQISRCIDYLSHPEKLPGYLKVLVKHGYSAANAILAFQVCYRGSSAEELDRWLEIVGNRAREQPLETIAAWVQQARQTGHCDAYRYLLEAVELSDLGHLKQAEPLVGFGREILRFLIEQKGLRSVQAIRDWYFKARGVEGLRSWGGGGASYHLLLDDAYSRNNFSFVTDNQSCVYAAVHGRVISKHGHRPHPADDTIKAAYDNVYKEQFDLEITALLPILPTILEQTNGILLSSIVRYAWEPQDVLQKALNELTPLINSLLTGYGPNALQLNEMETEAVAMFYRAQVDVVGKTWKEVTGRESDLAKLALRSHYVMTWQNSIRKLRTPLERSSLLALAHAKLYADKFWYSHSEDIFDICKHLRAKRLYQAARDPWALASHLGLLLAAARRDVAIAQWVSRELESISQMEEEGAEAFERLEQLDKLFNSTLPDALNEHAKDFLKRFTDSDAAFLAARLVGNEALPASTSGQEQLREAFRLAMGNTLAVYQRWVAREKCKFTKDKADNLSTKLSAMLSKHPAAYFAKHAADLCTKSNTLMWQEGRQAHLVIVDQKQRRLAGMALINVEPIPALDPSRDSLVIRAINPMDDMLATHTASSIVDAFFDVATQIAEDNDLAAVAFPWHNGAHLLSNQRAIEKDIEKRFIKHSVPLMRRHADITAAEAKDEWRIRPRSVKARFYAYEHGKEAVDTLYAIWPGNLAVNDSAEEASKTLELC